MSDDLHVETSRLTEVVTELGQLGAGARDRLRAAVNDQAALFEAAVIETKLSGQVLNQRSQALVLSVFHDMSDDGTSIMARVGADTPYARIHEFGGVIEPVNALALRFQINGQWVMVKRVTMPERSYLRSTLAERADEIRSTLTRAVAGVT